jgi:glutamate synthase (NADPH) small chain
MAVLYHDTETRPHVSVLVDRCAGCQECVVRCPTGALGMDPATWTVLADDAACVGCRQCVRTCPFAAITVAGPMLVGDRFDPHPAHPEVLVGNIDETRLGFGSWEDAFAEASRCLACKDPTCVRGCPAHNDIPGFIGALADGDLGRAHEVLARTSALPDVCSRVCNQSAQCEGACTWSLAGGVPVAIGRLERFVADHAPVPAPVPAGTRDLSVGVIGSGPAAVGAAWDLVAAGAAVTVYEKDEVPGGLCLWGIPDFTLPDDVARRPWRQLEAAGVEVRCGTEVRADDVEALLATHDAVIVAIGAGVPMRLAVPGSELAGVVDATTFLQGSKRALEPGGDADAFRTGLALAGADEREPRVLVLGAGNTAMDVARMARRLGLGATCVDWLDERFALARPDELAEARHEGVDVRFSRTLTALHGARGRVARAELAATRQRDAATTPTVLDDHEQLDVDLVVMAMGYRADSSYAAVLPGLPLRKAAPAVPERRWSASGLLAATASEFAHHSPVGALALSRESALWSAALPVRERVWVAGDALTGPSTVVEAMAQGRRAARAILDGAPSRPDRAGGRHHRPRVLVCYESRGGTTASAAATVAGRLRARGLAATLTPLSRVGPRELAAADAVVLGTWVEGLVVARVRVARATREWLSAQSRLGGRRVGIFCTFALNPRGALDQLGEGLEAKGGVVVDRAAFGPRELEDGHPNGPSAFADHFASLLLEETAVKVAGR